MNNLNYIYEIYRQRSFSAAAKKLYVSQPTLSIAVKKIEEKYGITIFNRCASGLELTNEGRVFINAIEQINNVEESLKTELADIAELKNGKITICSENFVASFIMPKILISYIERYPGIELSLNERNFAILKDSLLNEDTDIAITHEIEDDRFVCETLFEEEILLAVPDSFKLSTEILKYAFTKEEIIENSGKINRVDISLFSDHAFLLLKNSNDMYRRSQTIFKDANIKPEVKIYLDQMITSYNMACSGLGIAFVSDTVIKNSSNSGCIFFKLKSPHTKRKMTIVHKKNHYISKAAKAFIDTAKEVYNT